MGYKRWSCPLSPPTLSKLHPCPLSTSFTMMNQGCREALFIFVKRLTRVKLYCSPSFLYFNPSHRLREDGGIEIWASIAHFLWDLGNCSFHHAMEKGGNISGEEKQALLISRNHPSFPFPSLPCFFLIRAHLLLHSNTLLQESLKTLLKSHIFWAFTLLLTRAQVTSPLETSALSCASSVL